MKLFRIKSFSLNNTNSGGVNHETKNLLALQIKQKNTSNLKEKIKQIAIIKNNELAFK